MPLVNNMAARIDKNAPVLKSAVDGGKPILVELVDQDAQHRWLAKEIKALQAEGIDADNIAILAKTSKELSQTAIALWARGVSVYERYLHVKIDKHKAHLLALIQLTCWEQHRLNKRTKRLTPPEQEEVAACIENLWFRKKLKTELQARVSKKPSSILSVPSHSKHYKQINRLANAIKQAAGLPKVESAIQCLIDAAKPVLKEHYERQHKQLQRDLVDIKILARKCAKLDEVEAAWFDASVPDGVKGVQMLTVHSAKGQEWDYLFMINVVKGIYPRPQSNPESKKEEMRVFYVAVTRHHRQLYLLQTPVPVKCFTKKNGIKSKHLKSRILKKPSSFIDAKEQGLIRRVKA